MRATTVEYREITCVDFQSTDELAPVINGVINERRLLPSVGFTYRPIEGLSLRGGWSLTVARPSFRELGFYPSVEPGTDDITVGNPALQLSDVRSWDARIEYTWGFGDLWPPAISTRPSIFPSRASWFGIPPTS